MSNRKPMVLVNGQVQALQSSDTILASNVTSSSGNLNLNSSNGGAVVLAEEGSGASLSFQDNGSTAILTASSASGVLQFQEGTYAVNSAGGYWTVHVPLGTARAYFDPNQSTLYADSAGYISNHWNEGGTGQHQVRRFWSRVQTTDNTETTLWSNSSFSANTVVHVEATVLVNNASSTSSGSYCRHATFRITNSGIAQVGTTTSVHEQESVAGWIVALDTDATNIRVRVTGSATNLAWEGYITVYYAGNYA